jgi:small-conductance mechanosensitive channel
MWQSFVSELPNLAFLAVLLVVFRIVLRLLRAVFDALQRDAVHLRGFEAEWAQPTYKIVRFALIAFGLVVAYPYLPGSESAAFKGVSLFVGVLLSLGSSSAIANLVAGYSLIYRRAFKVGDRVKIGDVIGEVTESRIQVTRLRSLKNEEVVIPNSVILGGEVVNYSALARTHGLILHTQVGIGYETAWRQVEAMLLEAADRTPGIVRTRPPFVLQKGLGDFAVTYELNVYCDDAAAAVQIYTNLHRRILDVFNEYGVQIMTPAYEGDPEQPKVVAPSDWYAAPAVAPDRGVAVTAAANPSAGAVRPR